MEGVRTASEASEEGANPALRTGLDAVDAQHHHFVSLIGWLNQLSPAELGAPVGRRWLAELASYAALHFAFEQSLMRESDFPDELAHTAEHERIAEHLHAQGGRSAWSAADHTDFMRFLWRWFAEHTGTRDRELAEHVRRRGGRASAR